jgi:hypothetical protein
MDLDLLDGEHELIKDVPGFIYPIKIVVVFENNVINVVSSYPLKQGII